jgi:polar amino acid transport system permease protein
VGPCPHPACVTRCWEQSMQSSVEMPKRPSLIPGTDTSKWPWWAILLVMAGLAISTLIITNGDYRESFIFLKDGVATTLRITFFAYLLATVLGLFTGLGRVSKNPFLFNLSTLYVEIIRGIPLVVLLLYIAFALTPLIIDVLNSIGINISIRDVSNEWRAIIALGIGYGAYEGEVFRAGIQSIGKGQMEAARALGLTYVQAMRFIILPQAIRRVLPPLGNDFISLLKDSSLATVLAVAELTQLGRIRRSSTFRVLETFNVVAFMYLAMTLLLSSGVRWLEEKLKIQE